MNRNLSPDEFADIPEVIQQVADMHALGEGRGSARVVPHGGGGSYTIFGPNHVIQENVDAELDAGDIEGAAREAAYRPAATLYPGVADDPYGQGPFTPEMWKGDDVESVVIGMGGIDTREEATGTPPGEAWAEEVQTPRGVRGPASREAAEGVYRQWRGSSTR